MSIPTHQAVKLSQAQTGQTYQVCETGCGEPISQKLTLMGLGGGMVIELIALYQHGAVVKTPFGNIAIGSDLTHTIAVASI